MGYIDYQLKEAGHPGLKDFLRSYAKKRMHTSVTTDDFISDLEEYSNMSFSDEFRQYIYGGSTLFAKGHEHIDEKENPHHPAMTKADLESIL